ncbi:MAG: cytochrome C oxidase subunit IV family protein [Chloroflexi bacterium]|nr:cytochrome C oxidase subunit IV family protein [Chloroflexota bacterium]MBV9133760.1 cytochrome C oxidase subunit IV family protein [Chloroflexota bacterium]MBV9897648.1 cytochrome C oxidase subunit IV family protein [Chloroflexota bacterium]
MATIDHGHGHAEEHAVEHAHPGAKTYTIVGVILAIITVAEVFFYTQESVRAFLVPLLLVLSASKFVMVVGFYMHLKFDHPLFLGVFGFGLMVGGSIITALMFLFGQYPLPHHLA